MGSSLELNELNELPSSSGVRDMLERKDYLCMQFLLLIVHIDCAIKLVQEAVTLFVWSIYLDRVRKYLKIGRRNKLAKLLNLYVNTKRMKETLKNSFEQHCKIEFWTSALHLLHHLLEAL